MSPGTATTTRQRPQTRTTQPPKNSNRAKKTTTQKTSAQKTNAPKKMNPRDVGIDVGRLTPQQLYRWFLASFLFGRPIQQGVAAKTYRVLIDHGLTSPKKFASIEREPLRLLLDEGGYARLDYQTADRLHTTMAVIDHDYGSVNKLVRSVSNRKKLAEKIQKFAGVGPTTARIFVDAIPTKAFA